MNTTLDLVPRPAAAPARTRILSHARVEARLLLRNYEQLLLAVVIPVGILVAGHLWGGAWGADGVGFPAGVMALAIWSSCFTSLAIATGFERRYGVLERLAATPLGTSGLLGGKALAIAAVTAGQVTLLSVVAVVLGWRPAAGVGPTTATVAVVLLSAFAFANLGMIVAGRLRAETVLGVANLVYLLGAAVGGLLWPLSAHPGWAQPLLMGLPTAALGESLRAWAHGDIVVWPLLVVLLWAVVSSVIARRVFSWIS